MKGGCPYIPKTEGKTLLRGHTEALPLRLPLSRQVLGWDFSSATDENFHWAPPQVCHWLPCYCDAWFSPSDPVLVGFSHWLFTGCSPQSWCLIYSPCLILFVGIPVAAEYIRPGFLLAPIRDPLRTWAPLLSFSLVLWKPNLAAPPCSQPTPDSPANYTISTTAAFFLL